MKISGILLMATYWVAQGPITSYEDFKLVDQEIIYQRVFEEEDISYSQLEEYYKTLPYISNIEIKTNELRFDVSDLTVDYLKFQLSQVSTPLIMQTGKYSGKVSVGIKDGRYRITVSQLQVTGEIGYKSIKEKESLTSLACKNNGTQLSADWCKPNMLGLLGKAFADKLSLKHADNDW